MTSPSGSKWRTLAIAAFAVVLSLTTWFSATAIAPELGKLLDPSPLTQSWLTNGLQLGIVIGALGSSFLSLSDSMPLTRLMAASAVVAALANAVMLLEPGADVAIASRVVTGAALAGIYPAAMKFIATWFLSGRGLAMGTMVGALTLGSALPHLIRATGADLPWQGVFYATSLACLVSGVIFALVLREGPNKFGRTQFDPRQIGQIVQNKPVMLANLGYFGHMWELYALWAWFLAYASAASDLGGWELNASILTFAVIALGAAGWLADRIGRCTTTAIAMGISGISAVAIGVFFDGPVTVFVLVALIWGFTVVADSAQFSATVTELSDQKLVGSALAFQMGVGFALTIFVIWLVPLFAELFGGWRWAFVVLAPGPAVGVWAMLRLRTLPEAAKIANGKR